MSDRAEECKILWKELPSDERTELLAYFRGRQVAAGAGRPDGLSEERVEKIEQRITAYEKGESTPVNRTEFFAKMRTNSG